MADQPTWTEIHDQVVGIVTQVFAPAYRARFQEVIESCAPTVPLTDRVLLAQSLAIVGEGWVGLSTDLALRLVALIHQLPSESVSG